MTSNGSIAIVPPSTIIGDQIFLIQGAKVPFVLRHRPEDGNYTLIGECYVHGFMHGEMLTDDLKNRIDWIDII